MKRLLTTILLIAFTSLYLQAQLKEVKPTWISPLTFNSEGEKRHNDKVAQSEALYDKIQNEGLDYSNLTEDEQELAYFWEEAGGYYSSQPIGCSWYCGGGPTNITASSHLHTQAGNTYMPENIHDFDYSTAWVEGATGDGIGEQLTFHFGIGSPRVTHIYISNGYVKNQAAWENNGRIKKLKMYVDNEPYAILLLEDSRSEQEFEFQPIGNKRDEKGNILYNDADNEKKEWTLTFEIIEVYKGKKYNDVAISEINFSGLDVHCFAKGTPVNMADGTTKPIEELAIGDKVKVYDFESYSTTTATVKSLESAVHTHMVKYSFANGKELIATPDHPFMVRAKGWTSLNPEQTKQYKGFDKVSTIAEGDEFLSINTSGTISPIKLVSVEEIHQEQETYTITGLNTGNSFLVEGFIVGVEDLKP